MPGCGQGLRSDNGLYGRLQLRIILVCTSALQTNRVALAANSQNEAGSKRCEHQSTRATSWFRQDMCVLTHLQGSQSGNVWDAWYVGICSMVSILGLGWLVDVWKIHGVEVCQRCIRQLPCLSHTPLCSAQHISQPPQNNFSSCPHCRWLRTRFSAESQCCRGQLVIISYADDSHTVLKLV